MTCYQISVVEGTMDLEMLTSQKRFENRAEVDKFDFRNKLTLGVTRLGMWMEKGRQAVPDEAQGGAYLTLQPNPRHSHLTKEVSTYTSHLC